MPPTKRASENQRGILLMAAACTGFVLNDTFVKLASETLPIPQIIVIRSLIALPLVLLIGWRHLLSSLSGLRDRRLWLRTLAEVVGTATFLSALARMEIANATAVMQATPLAVTAAAALFLGERVGIRRWSAIAIGFAAVLLVIRPGMEGFSAWSLLALVTVACVVVRDLASRAMPMIIHPLTATIVALAALIPLGLAMSTFEPMQPVTLQAVCYCAGAAVALSVAYVLIVQAMRHGEISVVAPFRYVILLWALVIQVAVFAVWPDALTLLGSAILVATGLYTIYRERKLRAMAAADRAPAGLDRPLPCPVE